MMFLSVLSFQTLGHVLRWIILHEKTWQLASTIALALHIYDNGGMEPRDSSESLTRQMW